ncbi:tripartite tricarboxylate transporter substrate binding protein [Rhizobacter sp. Root404]|uniref:Bug family tripartite tricarboxylate transporter substrate binding protein n=1 Tax=Rhizobacter sp. Root404 TaxID=1736528 RepID=UPI0006FB282E|nr:tripartite tricarboxylate transporter substrate binding protein [Rhizobacter sp. Root404]KQW37728.1 LacI family transcriptional regulator [Rhizobacter sp. Root404]
MHPTRRTLLALAAALISTGALAQSYPAKAIRVLVPFPPGGGTDIIAREVTQKVSASTGWTFVIDNKPGAGGNLGIDAAAKSPADGYTLVLGQTSNLAINPTLYTKLPYNPQKDLAPIGLVASAPLIIVVPAQSAFKTVADLVAAAKAKPGEVNFASPGNGTVAHLTGELFQKTAGVKFQHVPYKGANQALTDVISGQVQIYVSSVPSVLQQVRTGKLRPLAVTSAKRVDDLPQTPTVGESGYKGFDAVTWFGFLAPAGTPKDIVTRLNTEFNKALQQPDLRKRLADEGATPLGGTPEQFADLIRDDIVRWGKTVKESGVRLD